MVQMCYFVFRFCCCHWSLLLPQSYVYSVWSHTWKLETNEHEKSSPFQFRKFHLRSDTICICICVHNILWIRTHFVFLCIHLSHLKFKLSLQCKLSSNKMCCVIYRQRFAVADASLMNETNISCTHTHNIIRTHSKRKWKRNKEI